MVRPAAKRQAVAHLREQFQMSERRACSVIAADRKTIRYRSLLRRDGEPSGVNRIYRLYREEGLTVRKGRAKRRAMGHAGTDPRGSQAQCSLVLGLCSRSDG